MVASIGLGGVKNQRCTKLASWTTHFNHGATLFFDAPMDVSPTMKSGMARSSKWRHNRPMLTQYIQLSILVMEPAQLPDRAPSVYRGPEQLWMFWKCHWFVMCPKNRRKIFLCYIYTVKTKGNEKSRGFI